MEVAVSIVDICIANSRIPGCMLMRKRHLNWCRVKCLLYHLKSGVVHGTPPYVGRGGGGAK